ncbi:uncharacterized acetyltransferase At3g50280-like [Zingiber officinale]|uniref:Uncharacterized protein n=1 Tax=Zingiber officinale TaxID=94328 RepID=A0A8J5FB34_ZINOF|nr:uncharacterized acetyltransferase At3g50280-like [Zingiber officinale]KAG6483343.1 hypothetical protein ZIOFF_059987 [Zingiber officinale]
MVSSSPFLRHVSATTIKPPPHRRTRLHLGPWDLSMLTAQYIQKGLLFRKPRHLTIADLIDGLKTSLSVALLHFYPLAGRFLSEPALDEQGNPTGLFVSIDCAGQGAEFVQVVAEGVTVADVLALDGDVPSYVNEFFPLDGAINYDAVVVPLLAVQVTELDDGLFLGCCFNHAVGDGTSYWQFFNAWAEIARSGEGEEAKLARPPVHDRWFVNGSVQPPIKFPFVRPEEFIERFKPPIYRERIFHLTADSIARLKAKANKESGLASTISSFQSVSGMLWRCITRARALPSEQSTRCRLAAQNRGRLIPPLSPDYFGNSIYPIATETTAGELLAHDLGWAARLAHEAVTGLTDAAIQGMVAKWMAAPVAYRVSMFDRFSVMMGSSPRFDVYGCEFGWGRAVAARSGTAHKFDGKVTLYPGSEGGGSMDLEICLEPPFMAALEADVEFMSAVSSPLPAPDSEAKAEACHRKQNNGY